MNIILALRNSATGIYIANLLCANGLVDSVVVESGRKARQRKLKRVFQGKNVFQIPLILLDLISITIYSMICEKYLINTILKPKKWISLPNVRDIVCVDDINDSKCIEFLKAKKPDILVVFGTSLLKKDVITIPFKFVLNIHGGIVPEYRNVHCDFWALLNKDYRKIGTSIIYLDERIDAGDIALYESIQLESNEGILIAKKKNVSKAGELILKFLSEIDIDHAPRTVQEESKRGFFPTPNFINLCELLIQIGRNKLSRSL